MNIVELLLLLSFIAFPAIELLSGGNTKRRILTGKVGKVRVYQETIIMLVVPTLLLVYLLVRGDVSPSDIGLVFNHNSAQYVALGLLLFVAIYYTVSLYRTVSNEEALAKLKVQLASVAWLLPTKPNEARWFIGGVSVAAGICEELLFRGYLLHAIGEYTNMTIAVAASCVLFGLCHIYQGWGNVLRTAMVGLVLSLVYLWSGSLVVAMVLHFMQDAYIGALHYCASKTTRPQ